MVKAWRWIRQLWWRLSEFWPISTLGIFLEAFPLFALWLFASFFAFRFFVSHFDSQVQQSKEIIALLSALVTALIGFGLQQWKQLTDEKQVRKRQRHEMALQKVKELEEKLKISVSEGARFYLDLKQNDLIGEDGAACRLVNDIWSASSDELKQAVEFLSCIESSKRFLGLAKSKGLQKTLSTIDWIQENLDGDLQSKARYGWWVLARNSSREFPELKIDWFKDSTQLQLLWRAVLKAWPQISLYRTSNMVADRTTAAALNILGIEGNPFGVGKAESDALLLSHQITPSCLGNIKAIHVQSLLFRGSAGSGKTALAFLMAYDNLKTEEVFPVYCPLLSDLPLNFDTLFSALAQTLLYYLSAVPRDFLSCNISQRTSMAYILRRYISSDLRLHFYQAGLPDTGDGINLLQQITELTQSASCESDLSDQELLSWVVAACPHTFDHVMFLLDVQEPSVAVSSTLSFSCSAVRSTKMKEFVEALLHIVGLIVNKGCDVRIFSPESLTNFLSKCEIDNSILLRWSRDDLKALLQKRLGTFGESSLSAWCSEKTDGPSLDDRLVDVALGAPGILIRKGDLLLHRVGELGSKPSLSGLSDILDSRNAS